MSKHTKNMKMGWGLGKIHPFTYVQQETYKEGTILSDSKLEDVSINISVLRPR